MYGDPAMGMAGAPLQIGYQDPSMGYADPSYGMNAGMKRHGAADAAENAGCRRKCRTAVACTGADAPILDAPSPLPVPSPLLISTGAGISYSRPSLRFCALAKVDLNDPRKWHRKIDFA